MTKNKRVARLVVAGSALSIAAPVAAQEVEELGRMEVVGVTPTHGIGLSRDKIPAYVQSATSEDIERTHTIDLPDFMNRNLGSVTLNAAQNNPLQPDLQYRGFTASPLLGLPQGLAVYQNGVRVNEPLSDAVNWDLLPDDAIASINLIGGTNPLFGLNSLGGALSIEMKNGFNWQGLEMDVSAGSWGRNTQSLQSGMNNGTFGYYVAVQRFDEDGWRDLSDSNALNLYASASYRTLDSTLDIAYQHGRTDLTGNGAIPLGLMEVDRSAIFTAPDETRNDLNAVTLNGSHFFTDAVQLAGTAFYRHNRTNSFNGDASEFEECDFGPLGELLIEGIDDDDVPASCAAGTATIAQIEALGGEVVEDVDGNFVDAESAAGAERDAINNFSMRKQESYGGDLQLSFLQDLFQRENQLVVGIGYYRGKVQFDADTEVTTLDPATRSTRGSTDTGVFLEEARTRVDTSTESVSIYFTDTLSLTDRLAATFSGRYNHTNVTISDRSGVRPELNGDHVYNRFNPAVGLTFQATDYANVYGSYSESSRAPTAIELSCNEEIAERFEARTGEDDYECRLPNAFLADPPLEQVVTKTYEAGVRGRLGLTGYHVGYFRSTNHDDIIFQSTGRATGLFKNVDETRRQGVETALTGFWQGVSWYAAYTYLDATFESAFDALSPNHPNANAAGIIRVNPGDRIPGLPEHSFKFGADYSFANGFTIGGDLIANSDQVMRGDESNQLETVDGYAVLNLRMSYNLTDNVQFYGLVNNVFDSDYETFGLIGEAPGEVVGLDTLANQSPFFRGPAPPIGGWLGVRIRL